MKNKKGLVPYAEKCLLFKSDYLRLVKIGPTLFFFLFVSLSSGVLGYLKNSFNK